ncbi:MAG: hypothetical protein KatS3mg115_2476 [Candidatus Poribacteria bacterium]|nr:MAG: hypothetical protein KatS3mg115_2476 [Candidatus Poribacteria bacterium]
MGLNPNLIHLMTVRNQGQTETAPGSTAPTTPPASRSFQEVLEESLSSAERAGEVSRAVLGSVAPSSEPVPSSDRVRRYPPSQVLSPERLLQKFVVEHDLVLAAQRTPEGRPRYGAEDDPNGERVRRSNLHPVE